MLRNAFRISQLLPLSSFALPKLTNITSLAAFPNYAREKSLEALLRRRAQIFVRLTEVFYIVMRQMLPSIVEETEWLQIIMDEEKMKRTI